jgi:hypothetical protein
MICSKCNIDKEEDQYATYFHSTQNKFRTRRICKSCFNEQKRIYRENFIKEKIIQQDPVYIYSRPVLTPTPEPLVETKVFIDMDTKVCSKCFEDKPVSDFYIHSQSGKPFSRCKRCELNDDNERYRQQIEDNGGSDRVRSRPGEWIDEYQRENVECFLKVIGWKFNGKIWWKEGQRGEDGQWEKMRGMKKYRKPIRNRLSPIYERLKSQAEDIVKLRDAGETLITIAGIYNTSIPTLYKVINEYYEAQKDSRTGNT